MNPAKPTINQMKPKDNKDMKTIKPMNPCDLVVGESYRYNNVQDEDNYLVIYENRLDSAPFHGQYEFDVAIFTDSQVKEYITPVKPVKPTKHLKPLNQSKPRVTISTNGRRQFDVNFKLMVVRNCISIRKTKEQTLTKYLNSMGVSRQVVSYWNTQFNQGHFGSTRAVAFSRKVTMVHG